jgi:hypothetical protein
MPIVACYGDDAAAVVDLAADPLAVLAAPVGSRPATSMVRYGPYAVAIARRVLRYLSARRHRLRVMDMATQTMVDARMIVLTARSTSGPSCGRRALGGDAGARRVARIDVAAGTVAMQRFFTDDECVAPHEVQLVAAIDRVILVCEGDHIAPGAVLSSTRPRSRRWAARCRRVSDALRVVDVVDW